MAGSHIINNTSRMSLYSTVLGRGPGLSQRKWCHLNLSMRPLFVPRTTKYRLHHCQVFGLLVIFGLDISAASRLSLGHQDMLSSYGCRCRVSFQCSGNQLTATCLTYSWIIPATACYGCYSSYSFQVPSMWITSQMLARMLWTFSQQATTGARAIPSRHGLFVLHDVLWRRQEGHISLLFY